MSHAFSSWEERPDKLLPSRSNRVSSQPNEDAHPTAKWIQEQNKNHSEVKHSELDEYGIPIHPSQSGFVRHSKPSSHQRNPSASSPNARHASSSALKPSFSSRQLPATTSSTLSSSSSWQVPPEDPYPPASRIGPQHKDADEDESIGLVLGQSKRRRARKDSYSSLGSSVLPAPLFASNSRYGPPTGSLQPVSAKPGRSTYPSSNHSGAAPPSRQLAPQNEAFAPHHSSQSRQRFNSTSVAPRPSGVDLEDWLRTAQYPSGLRTSPSLGLLPSINGQERHGLSGALSEAGTRRRRHQGGSTSGFSAGVLSAGPESPRSRARSGASASRREHSAFPSLSSDHPAFMASRELNKEVESRTIDTIEEWRAKSGAQDASHAADASPQNPNVVAEPATRRRRKSSLMGSSRPSSVEGPIPPLPNIPATFAAESVTSKGRRRRRRDTGNSDSLARLLSPDTPASRQSISERPSLPPALRDLYALSGLGSQADTPARRFIRWLAKEQLKSITLPSILLAAFFIRWTIASGGWSGKGVEPVHGDFEAQRHWIELTLVLPTSQWYFYDLKYWGLDYPPLTAWISLACGYASRLFPSTAAGFAFETSRGNEDAATAVFMRATVVAGDVLFYLPAITLFISRKLEGRGKRTQAIALLSILLQPSLILIDHGHFQYNSIMLGLSAACFALLYTTLPNPDASSKATPRARNEAVVDLSRHLSYEYVVAAVFFCLSLSFKQMALYYAPAVFAVMLGRCIGLAVNSPERGLSLFIGLGLSVVITFGVIFSPWLTSIEQIGQLVFRIFPLARGLFEDKVSNVWCFLTVLPLPQRLKLRNMMEPAALARVSLLVTLAAILPGCCLLFWAARQTAKMEMMVAQETVTQGAASVERATALASIAGSTKSPTVASQRSNAFRGHRSPSVIGSAAGGAARSEIESLLAGSVSRSISGRMSHVGEATDRMPISHDSDHHLASARPVASTLPSPAAQMLPYGLVSVSCAFFLFGFQVHEKSILLPLLPMTLMLGAKGDTWGGNITPARDWEWSVWFNNIATFSLYPLLKKDGQSMQYVVLTLVWNWLIGNLSVPLNPLASVKAAAKPDASFFRRLSTLTYLGVVALHAAEVLIPWAMPALQASVWARYPDIYPVLNVLLTTPCFGIVYVWALIRQVQVAFATGLDLSLSGKANKKVTKPL